MLYSNYRCYLNQAYQTFLLHIPYYFYKNLRAITWQGPLVKYWLITCSLIPTLKPLIAFCSPMSLIMSSELKSTSYFFTWFRAWWWFRSIGQLSTPWLFNKKIHPYHAIHSHKFINKHSILSILQKIFYKISTIS